MKILLMLFAAWCIADVSYAATAEELIAQARLKEQGQRVLAAEMQTQDLPPAKVSANNFSWQEQDVLDFFKMVLRKCDACPDLDALLAMQIKYYAMPADAIEDQQYDLAHTPKETKDALLRNYKKEFLDQRDIEIKSVVTRGRGAEITYGRRGVPGFLRKELVESGVNGFLMGNAPERLVPGPSHRPRPERAVAILQILSGAAENYAQHSNGTYPGSIKELIKTAPLDQLEYYSEKPMAGYRFKYENTKEGYEFTAMPLDAGAGDIFTISTGGILGPKVIGN